MQIKYLWLYNFRNYKNSKLKFSGGTNLFIGKNGAGKTNLLEAVYYLSSSKSFRSAMDRDIKRWNSDSFALEGFFTSKTGDFKAKFKIQNGKKELYINDLLQEKISNIVGKVLVVPFLFDDIYLITGPPSKRRSFMDFTLSMSDEKYFGSLKNYILAIRQKNSLLKRQELKNRELIKVWNKKISEYASYIVMKRKYTESFFNRVIEKLKDKDYFDRFAYKIKYISALGDLEINPEEKNDELTSKIYDFLNSHIDREISLRSCIYGPHRDDFLFYKDNFTVRKFGSVGEGRITSIILRKCQIEMYRYEKNIEPILLIDDIFLELDRDVKRISKKIIGDGLQILMTTTSEKNIPDNMKYDKIFYISRGNLEEKNFS